MRKNRRSLVALCAGAVCSIALSVSPGHAQQSQVIDMILSGGGYCHKSGQLETWLDRIEANTTDDVLPPDGCFQLKVNPAIIKSFGGIHAKAKLIKVYETTNHYVIIGRFRFSLPPATEEVYGIVEIEQKIETTL